MTSVQRFVARVKPHRDHSTFFEWQTATACVFVGDDDRVRAQKIAEREIRTRHWERIEFIERGRLIEERVRSQGGEVLDAFLQAQGGQPFWVEQLDEIPFSKKGKPLPISVPRLSEAFIDQVVIAAGGQRIDVAGTAPNRPKAADYRIGRLILELKDLQSEGLEVETRQAKIAELFSSKLRPDRSVGIDPDLLTPEERKEYIDIVAAPVRKRLVDAGQQVRATLGRSKDKRLRGGAILLNTGYGSLPPAILGEIAAAYAAQSTTIRTVICISAWTVTNGFDTMAYFNFTPEQGGTAIVRRLRKVFLGEINAFMTLWGRSGFAPANESSPALRPIVFETLAGVFSHTPPKAPNSVGWPSEK